jgi:hypothetical protein
MKGLLNEVSRLQKLAGILNENSVSDYQGGWETARSQRTNAANYKQDKFEYKCDGDKLLIRLDMSGIEKVITIVQDGDFYTADLGKVEKSGSDIYLKVGLNDLIITNLIQKCFGNVSEEDMNGELEEKKEKPGLWANIRAQRARGEKPARKGSKEYNKAVKAAKEINKDKK